ncbi:MAG: 1,4-dihydroxy-2-naphthoate octaprenyltransferase [Cyclobacteriaceae bacterium]|jgi:1,4-dihydroxy-2-naphthoate octaprenyltransferase
MKKSTLLHLRIPFSYFLLPVFLFSLAVFEGQAAVGEIMAIGLILHIFLYPASNGFNSYFDKDEESIGGLRNPPKVDKELYWTALFFDAFALGLGLYFGYEFVLMLFLYGLVSKAYSHPSVRLKKYPVIGWVAAGLFQGYFTFIMVLVGLQGGWSTDLFDWSYQLPAVLTTALLFGSYPMTQVYQHGEDARRGDMTISRRLGILGTFHFTAGAFFFSSLGYVYFVMNSFDGQTAILFLVVLTPVLLFFGWWYLRVRKDLAEANFTNTMLLNWVSATVLNAFFFYLYWL